MNQFIQTQSSTTTMKTQQPGYRDAYARINGMVVVGESLADRHFRLLARAIPHDQQELSRLAAMEGRHARDFSRCAQNLGVKPDLAQAKHLFAPLHDLFLRCDKERDLEGCLVIQGLIVECFAVAAYRSYLPVADDFASPITAAVIHDEAEHLGYAERWLQQHLQSLENTVLRIGQQALPITIRILQRMATDMQTIGMDPTEVLAEFMELFLKALMAIGIEKTAAQRLFTRAAASALTA